MWGRCNRELEMTRRLPEKVRRGVIDSWLLGDPARVTAIKNGISEGSVSNIIEEYRQAVGTELAEMLRSLAIVLSKTGLTAAQCGDGHRIIMIMKRMGATDQSKYENFLFDISNRYVEAGLDPAHLFEQLNELHFFLEKNSGPQGRISIPQIEAIIENKKAEERELDRNICMLNSQKAELEKSVSDLRFEKARIESELGWDSEIKRNLIQHGFRNEEVSKFMKAANLLRERGYNISEIVEYFGQFQELRAACSELQRRSGEATLELENKNLEIGQREELLKIYSQRINNLIYLEGIGFGLSEFKQLRYLIQEIAEQQQQDGKVGNEAVKKFFDDLENHYYDYLWLRKRVDRLKAEKYKLDSTDSLTLMREQLGNFISSLSPQPQSVPRGTTSGVERTPSPEAENDFQKKMASSKTDTEACATGVKSKIVSSQSASEDGVTFSGERNAEVKVRQPPSNADNKEQTLSCSKEMHAETNSEVSKGQTTISTQFESLDHEYDNIEPVQGSYTWAFLQNKYQEIAATWPDQMSANVAMKQTNLIHPPQYRLPGFEPAAIPGSLQKLKRNSISHGRRSNSNTLLPKVSHGQFDQDSNVFELRPNGMPHLNLDLWQANG
jgi:hypothetical protein